MSEVKQPWACARGYHLPGTVRRQGRFPYVECKRPGCPVADAARRELLSKGGAS